MADIAPGIHFSMSMADYLAIPALSNGVIRTLLERCPAAAWHGSPFNPKRVRDDTKASDAGTLAHAILLEGSEDGCEIFDPSQYLNADGKSCATGWTNKAIKEARDACRLRGKVPILQDDMAEIRTLVAAARRYIDSLAEHEPHVVRAFAPDGGHSEVVMVWSEGDTLCKLRTDRISTDFGLVVDYKSTALSVEPSAWARTNLDYMGAAWYRRGIRAVTGVEPDYLFLAGEREPPYLHSLLGVLPADLALGDEMVGEGLRQWQRCERDGVWPGYPARAAYAEAPLWHRNKWDERNGVGEDGVPATNAEIWNAQRRAA